MKIFNEIKNLIRKNKFLSLVFKPIKKIYANYLNHVRKKQFKKNGKNVILITKKALDSANVHFWLDYGTLLGVTRDKKLIKNDLDIDIGIFLADYSEKIEESMYNFGFKLIREYIIDNKQYGLEQTYELDGVSVDLFYYSTDKDKMWSHVFVNFPNMTIIESLNNKGGLLPIEQYFPKVSFSSICFLNENFSIPHPVNEYLSFHYGEDYKIPRKWDYRDLKNDNKNAKYLFDKIGVFKPRHPICL